GGGGGGRGGEGGRAARGRARRSAGGARERHSCGWCLVFKGKHHAEGKGSAGSRGTRAGGRDSVPGSADETGAAGYRPLLFSIAYGMTRSVGDAGAIVQDAFRRLTRARPAGNTIPGPNA